MNEDVEAFTDWFLSSMPPIWAVPFGECIWKIEDVTSILLYRQPPYQVQAFIVPPGYIIPEHTHPNVDSIEVYVGGDIKFSHGGKWVTRDERLTSPGDGGLWAMRGSRIRVRPTDPHGGVFGKRGGIFLSSQYWLNGVDPHCVSADYTGVVMGPSHFSSVKAGLPILSDMKTAASLEST